MTTREEFIDAHEFGEDLLEYYGDDLDEAIDAVEDRYQGVYESLEDYAREYFDVTHVPDNILVYIDYDRIASDLEQSGEVIVFEYGHRRIHVFIEG